jgi:hypothetical protein
MGQDEDVKKFIEEGGVLQNEMYCNLWDGVLVRVMCVVPLRGASGATGSTVFLFSDEDGESVGQCTADEVKGIVGALKKFKDDVSVFDKAFDALDEAELEINDISLGYRVGDILIKGIKGEKKGVFSSKAILGFSITLPDGGFIIEREMGEHTVYELNCILQEAEKLNAAMVKAVKSR